MNKTLYFLWFSDIFIITGFGLVSPLMAIYITGTIVGGSILGAGIATALFLIVKALVQIPFSKYIDSHKDRTRWLWIGTFLVISVPIQYVLARNMMSIYIAQIIYGLGAGLANPAWLGIWSNHLDKHHESFEWSLYGATTGLGAGLTAFLGAASVTYFGFKYTMGFMGLLSLIGFITLLYIEDKDYKSEINQMHYHKRHKLVEHQHHR